MKLNWHLFRQRSAPPAPEPMQVRLERALRTIAMGECQARDLYALMQMPGYAVLLDVMEMACVKLETELINTDARDDAGVLAAHKLSKAAWLFFVWVQKFVQHHVNEALAPRPVRDPDIAAVENLLDPLN